MVLFSMWMELPSAATTAATAAAAGGGGSGKRYEFVSGGGRAIHFWTVRGSSLKKDSGRFGVKFKQVPLLCATSFNTNAGVRVAAGTSTGAIYVFSDRDVVDEFQHHHLGRVTAITTAVEGTFVISGSSDGAVCVHNAELQPVSLFDVKKVRVHHLVSARNRSSFHHKFHHRKGHYQLTTPPKTV
jgi:hypothetical protein